MTPKQRLDGFVVAMTRASRKFGVTVRGTVEGELLADLRSPVASDAAYVVGKIERWGSPGFPECTAAMWFRNRAARVP